MLNSNTYQIKVSFILVPVSRMVNLAPVELIGELIDARDLPNSIPKRAGKNFYVMLISIKDVSNYLVFNTFKQH